MLNLFLLPARKKEQDKRRLGRQVIHLFHVCVTKTSNLWVQYQQRAKFVYPGLRDNWAYFFDNHRYKRLTMWPKNYRESMCPFNLGFLLVILLFQNHVVFIAKFGSDSGPKKLPVYQNNAAKLHGQYFISYVCVDNIVNLVLFFKFNWNSS